MKKIKGLTDSQNNLIVSLVNELISTNKEAEKISTDVIGQLFREANKEAMAERNFYHKIYANNLLVEKMQKLLMVKYMDKLSILFKDYSFVKIKQDGNVIFIGEPNGSSYLRGYFYISFGITLDRNTENDSVGFRFKDGCKSEKKYKAAYACIDGNSNHVIELGNFEENEIFKERVLKMFNEHALRS